MRPISLLILLFLAASCSATHDTAILKSVSYQPKSVATEKETVPEPEEAGPYDMSDDIERFLAAETPEEEKKVLKALQLRQVSHEDVKARLREWPLGSNRFAGLQKNLETEYNGHKYSYALFTPASIAAEKNLPLIVILHGLGSSGQTIIEKWTRRLQGQAIILCPTYPMGAWWALPAEKMVLQLIQKTQAEYPVDRNRVFLSGLSNGAIGAYMIGMFNPDYFAGIIPIAGSVTQRLLHFLVNLSNTPLYIIHGRGDPIFPIAGVRRIHQILSDMGYPVVYREHQEAGTAHGGHFLPESEVAPLAAWLRVQKRRRNPRTVRMTREGNHLGPIQWARIAKGIHLASLQIPGPENEPLNVKDGKIATMVAMLQGDNRIHILSKNLLEYEVYLNTEMVDFDVPIHISAQEILDMGKKLAPGETHLSFHHKVEKDLAVLLRSFKARRDPDLLFDASIRISLEKKFVSIANP
ncbi:MAG: hypothetical protein ACE5GQ_00630 [Nitrospinales bacterium]